MGKEVRRVRVQKDRRAAKGERVTKRVTKEALTGRLCYYIPPTQEPSERGYRVAVVVEGEGGYRWTGDESRGQQPYYWGLTLAEAERCCAAANEKLGLTAKQAAIIVARSMAKGMRE